MAATDGTEPITEDEFLYRRIPVSQPWYDATSGRVDADAFRPTAADQTGLSLGRAKYLSPEAEAAKGRASKEYRVAVLRAVDLIRAGIIFAPRPLTGDPGHLEIPTLTYDNRKSDTARGMCLLLAKAVDHVDGPFPGKTLSSVAHG
jgi:hypothetical protein